MGFKQHISRTWQMIEQQVNDVPFRPHDEACIIANGAEFCAEVEKSHC